ncbi:MAG: hypothetical protein M3133_05780 [Actinomycetota bacterium]|nr:hypothetical protein [Actinomycetota bacterium]
MRRGLVLVGMLVCALMGPVLPGSAQEEPPRGPCNRGTMTAHHRVPHATEGNEVAHDRIPHCPHG